MIATLLSTATIVLCAVLGGQFLCAAAGARRWTSAAPAVGLSALMVVAVPGLHLPGRLTLPFVVIIALGIVGAALLLRRPRHRPPRLWGVPVLLAAAVVLIPFFAARRFGTLGVSFDNDMANHLLIAGAYRDRVIEHAAPILASYPIGPHALAATLAHGWAIGVDGAFAGFTIAMVVLAALVAYGLLAKLPRGAAVLAALAAAAQYLSASYLGQGSFKELALITLLIGLVAALIGLREGALAGRGRLAPIGLIVAGVLSVYSLAGLAWVAGIVGGVACFTVAARLRRGGVAGLAALARAHVAPAALGLGVCVIALITQAPRIKAFYHLRIGTGTGTGIAKTTLGNLVGPLNPFQATGSWLSADFRFAPADVTPSKAVGVLVLAAALWGLVRLVRRSEPELAVAAVVCGLLWWYSDRTQSPYVAAKALVIASPFLVVLAAIGLLDDPGSSTPTRAARRIVAAGIFAVLAVSSFEALRYLPVGPRTHELQLAAFRPLVRGESVLFLGNDDFASWELSGARVLQPAGGGVAVAPDKPWTYGQPLDWDSVAPATLDGVDAVILPIDPSGSQAPPNFHLVRRSGAFALYRRRGPTPPRTVLAESGAAGARLDCASAAGRRLRRAGGVAAVRSPPVAVTVPTVAQGTSVSVTTPRLRPGRYFVGLQYLAAQRVRVQGPGLDVFLPANLDRPGPVWPAGPITLSTAGPVAFRVAAAPARLVSPGVVVAASTMMLTPDLPERVISLAHACGRYVDWYRTAGR